MTYKLLVASERVWAKDLSKLSGKELRQLLQKINELRKEPWPTNVSVKKLQHYDLADFRLRVGSYRVLFDRDLGGREIVLYRVLHRSRLY